MTHTPAGGPAHAVAVNLADVSQEVPLGASPSAELLLAWDHVGTQVDEAACGCRATRWRSSGSADRPVGAGSPSVTIRAHPRSRRRRRRQAD